MKAYMFSPIKTEEELMKACEYLHIACNQLCKLAFNTCFPTAGNLSIFCHYNDEFEFLKALRKKLTQSSDNAEQKFFKLYNPINFLQREDIPSATYDYLYIRRPKEDSPTVGDIDFYLEDDEFSKIKNKLLNGEKIQGARIYDRPDLDMIEVYNSNLEALSYVSTKTMTEKVRVKQSDLTIL